MCVCVRARACEQRIRTHHTTGTTHLHHHPPQTQNAPEVGSSRRRTEGSASSSVAMFSRFRSPPESPVVGRGLGVGPSGLVCEGSKVSIVGWTGRGPPTRHQEALTYP